MSGQREVFEKAMQEGNSAAWDQEWDKAIAAYSRALKEFPEDTNTLDSIGMAFIQTDRLRDALRAYSRAASLDKKDLVAVENTADLLERMGRMDDAARAYVAAAEIQVSRRELSKAIDAWRRAALLTPTLVQAHARLASAYEATKQVNLAVVEYLAVARIMQKRGNFAAATKATQNAQRLDANNPEVVSAIDKLQTGGELSDSYLRSAAKAAKATGPLQLPPDMAFAQDEAPPDVPIIEELEGSASSRDNPLEDVRKNAVELLANAIFEISSDANNPLVGVRGDRDKIITHLGKAIDAQTREDFKTAVEAYEKAIKAGLDHPAAQLTTACIYMDHQNYSKAIKHFKTASANPKYAAAAYYGMGLAYGRDQKMREATEHLLQCLRAIDLQTVSKEHASALSTRYENLLANLNSQPNDEEIEDLADSLIRFLSGPNWMERAHQARRQLNGQTKSGVAPLADLLSIPGAEHVFEAMDRIEQYLKKNYLETALDEALYAISHAPSYLPAHLKLAEILQRSKRVDAAVVKYSVVASLYQARGEAEKSGEILHKMVKLAPMDLGVRTKLVDLLVAQGKTDDALRQYIDIGDVYYRLANLDMCRETLTNALRLAQRSQVDRAWTLQILHRMGDIDIQRLDWRQALRVYEQIKTLAPNDEKARTSLAELYLRMGQSQQALKEMDDVLRRWLPAGQIEPAIAMLEELTESYSKEMGLRTRLARVYQRSGRKADAIAQFDTLGELQLEAGLHKEATQTIKHILTLNPENAEDYQALLSKLQPGR